MIENEVEHGIPFTRNEVIDEFITSRKQQANELLLSAKKSFEISAQMDGKMISRYDTQKEDHAADGNMKLAAAQSIKDKLERFEEWSKVSENVNSEIISYGNIFLLKDLVYDTQEWFFLLELSGGTSIQVNNVEIIGIHQETPLALKALGKKVGETIRYEIHGEEQKFKVLVII